MLRHLIASLTNCICTDVPVSYSRIKDARYGFLHNKPPLSTSLFSCDCGNFRKILKIGIYVGFFFKFKSLSCCVGFVAGRHQVHLPAGFCFFIIENTLGGEGELS